MWFLHWAYQCLIWLEADYRAKPCDGKWRRNSKMECKITENSLHTEIHTSNPQVLRWLWILDKNSPGPFLLLAATDGQKDERANGWVLKWKGGKTNEREGSSVRERSTGFHHQLFFPCVFGLMALHLAALIKLVYCAHLWIMALHC